jgi:transcriptional regulator with XRE-family HTH domain
VIFTKTIGEQIKAYRHNKNMTQEEISAALGISQSSYSRIEANKILPSPLELYRLSIILQFSVDTILENAYKGKNHEINREGLSFLI